MKKFASSELPVLLAFSFPREVFILALKGLVTDIPILEDQKSSPGENNFPEDDSLMGFGM